MSGPDFEKMELIPVIAQDDETGEVLMLAYMNEQAWGETVKTGRVCYYSRSRSKLWRKGEESGNVQEVKSIFYDCDADTLLIRVNQIGAFLGMKAALPALRSADGGSIVNISSTAGPHF